MNTIKRIGESHMDGTHLIGTFRATYNELVETLGEAIKEDGYKVSVRWVLEYCDEVYTLYDWKEDVSPQELPERMFLFHIGGTDTSKPWIDIFCELLHSFVTNKAIVERGRRKK